MGKEEGLSELVKRGGIYSDIGGKNPEEVLIDLIGRLPIFPLMPADNLLQAVLEREDLMSTGIGKGIALPHPRNPLISPESEQFTALAYLKNPVDWNSLDGEKVDTLLLIISASSKQHLVTLSEINFLCRQAEFIKLLKERAALDELLAFIREAEKQWR